MPEKLKQFLFREGFLPESYIYVGVECPKEGLLGIYFRNIKNMRLERFTYVL